MKKQILLAALSTLLLAGSAFAQLPPGKWWRHPEIITNLSLTEEQQTRLDGTFRAAANDLIDMKAEVEKQSIALRGELDQPQLNRANIQRVAARLNEARGRLFESELMMLADMRGVLTDQQWSRMRAELDHMGMRNNIQRRGPGMQGEPMNPQMRPPEGRPHMMPRRRRQ